MHLPSALALLRDLRDTKHVGGHTLPGAFFKCYQISPNIVDVDVAQPIVQKTTERED